MKRKRPGCLARLAAACILLIACGFFWWYGNFTIDREILTVTSSRLPEAFDGFRAAVISDLHGKVFGDGSGYLISETKKAEPDIILLTGDLIETDGQKQMLPPLLEGLAAIAPVFYITGNHEWALEDIGSLLDLLESSGVMVLENAYRTLTLGGTSIVVAGVDDPNGPYDMKTPAALMDEIRSEQGDPFVLMLAHRNDSLSMWAELDTDAVVCGHGHGGIIRLPFLGGLIGVDRQLFPKYTSGLYAESGTAMLVSRGLGNSVVDFRIFNRPHLPVLELRRGA